MDGILTMVMGQLGGGGPSALGGMLGLGRQETTGAVGTAVNVLTGAMAQDASQPAGAAALDAALEKDHDGSIFDHVGDFMSGSGSGILGHVLGGNQPQVEQGIAQKTGLSLDKVGPLLITVAPLVMGALGKMKKDKGMDAQAVASTLATERAEAEQQDDGMLGSILGSLGSMGGAPQPAPQPQPQSSGGLLGMLGGLFKRKGN